MLLPLQPRSDRLSRWLRDRRSPLRVRLDRNGGVPECLRLPRLEGVSGLVLVLIGSGVRSREMLVLEADRRATPRDGAGKGDVFFSSEGLR